MAAALPIIGGITSVAGGVVGATGAIKQSEAQRDAALYNAARSERDAAVAVDQAYRDSETQQRQSRVFMGGVRAAYGASGVTSEGSPSDVLRMSAVNAELDRQAILYKGNLRAMGFIDEAQLDRMEGGTAIQQGQIRAATSILTGAANAVSIGTRAGATT